MPPPEPYEESSGPIPFPAGGSLGDVGGASGVFVQLT